MAVGDHGTVHWARRVDVEIAGFAVEAGRLQFQDFGSLHDDKLSAASG
jgi:hypothetical protein